MAPFPLTTALNITNREETEFTEGISHQHLEKQSFRQGKVNSCIAFKHRVILVTFDMEIHGILTVLTLERTKEAIILAVSYNPQKVTTTSPSFQRHSPLFFAKMC